MVPVTKQMTSDNDSGRSDLAGFPYHELLNVARSAGLDLSDQPKKDALIDRMVEANIEHESGTWQVDGEEVERKPVQTGSGSTGPTDTTVLYCLPRDSTEDHVDAIREALEQAGYEFRLSGESSENYKIVDPVEVEDEDNPAFDPEGMNKDDLYEMAQDLDIDGRSEMTKDELVEAVAIHW